MGAHGTGLYADDFAADLRASVRTLCRLPLDGDEIVDLLVSLNPVESDPSDDDHVTFWMVVADQLHRAGITSRATAMAVELIRSGRAIAAAEQSGWSAAVLRKRSAVLNALADRLEGPIGRRRRGLKRPQPLLLEPGEICAFPIDAHGRSVNPYFSDARIAAKFEPVAWSSMLVAAAGRHFDFFTWYFLAPSRRSSSGIPSFDAASAQIDPTQGNVGTLPATAIRRLRLERLGVLGDFEPVEPDPRRIEYVVANDISAANLLWARVVVDDTGRVGHG